MSAIAHGRQGEPEAAAAPRGTLDADLPAHGLGQPQRDREPEPGSLTRALPRDLDALERLEERREVFGGDADAGILDAHQGHAAAALEPHLHASLVGELERVGHQVAEYLPYA